jgi:pSer/pThr/pTyr-binding forkhead associated (FHA) protein
MASLIVASGVNKGDYYPLGQRTNVIGRDEALPIQIIDKSISRKHMRIRFDQDKYYVDDMDSRHGVLVNGIKIDNQTALSDNDYILIGRTALMFTLKDFENRENALLHFKKVGERIQPTVSIIDKNKND